MRYGNPTTRAMLSGRVTLSYLVVLSPSLKNDTHVRSSCGMLYDTMSDSFCCFISVM